MSRALRPSIIPLLAMIASACGGEAGTTGWIPSNGGVSGVISVASDVAPPSATAPQSSPDPTPLVWPTPLAEDALVYRVPPASPVEQLARPEFATNDLIVTLRPGAAGTLQVGATMTGTEARSVGAALRSHLSSLLPEGASIEGISPVILTAKVRLSDSVQLDAVAATLRNDATVLSVTRNRRWWLDDSGAVRVPRIPNNPLYVLQSWHYGMIDLPRAWGVTTGSSSVLVAVVDDGIRFDHPGIAANLTSDGYDFVNAADSVPLCGGGKIANAGDGGGPDSDPTVPSSYNFTQASCFAPGDLGGHGLHVAGTIGAVGNNGVGMTGVNWTVKIRPVRVLGVAGFGLNYDIAQGILYAAGLPADDGAGGLVQAATGARIINLSLSGGSDDPTIHSAVISATNAGVFVVASAGNGGDQTLRYPAAYPEVFAVAAVKPDGLPTAYSSYGSYVDLRAPGGDFNQGGGSGGVGSTMWSFTNKAPDYAFLSGTSMAAPHVAGVAALLLAKEPSLTPADLRSRLTRWSVGPSNSWGAGTLNAYNSLTQSFGPPRKLFARLYSASTGEIGEKVEAGADGSYSFTHVRDGAYFIYGGADEDGDGQIGLPGRWWGALGGPVAPSRAVLLTESQTPASFSIGFPTISVADHSINSRNLLPIGGYFQAVLADRALLDVYRVKIPKSGTYTFETSGWVGGCGLALEEATGIGIYDLTGRLITSRTYIDAQRYNYCTRLAVDLATGEYLVAVAGAFSGGRYRLQARAGS